MRRKRHKACGKSEAVKQSGACVSVTDFRESGSKNWSVSRQGDGPPAA